MCTLCQRFFPTLPLNYFSPLFLFSNTTPVFSCQSILVPEAAAILFLSCWVYETQHDESWVRFVGGVFLACFDLSDNPATIIRQTASALPRKGVKSKNQASNCLIFILISSKLHCSISPILYCKRFPSIKRICERIAVLGSLSLSLKL